MHNKVKSSALKYLCDCHWTLGYAVASKGCYDKHTRYLQLYKLHICDYKVCVMYYWVLILKIVYISVSYFGSVKYYLFCNSDSSFHNKWFIKLI